MRRSLTVAFLAATAVAAVSAARPVLADGEAAAPPAPAAPALPSVGSEAPDFTLKDSEGNDVKLSSYRGKKNVVIAFYPKAHSKLCTTEMKCFATEWRKVDERGAVVLAVSGDPVAELRKFASATGARYPMLSDAGLAVAKTYGVYNASPDGGYASRAAFLVDQEGKIRWLSREFAAPRTLEGTELLTQLDKLRPAAADPLDALASLPSPDRDAKTVLVRWVQGLLAEDLRGCERLLHRDFGAKPGYTPAMIQTKRDAELDRLRKLFEAQDLRAVALADVLDPRDGRTLAKGDQEKPGALGGYSEEAKKAVAELPEGDVLLVARTKARVVGDAPLLQRETWLQLRKDGDAWKIVSLTGRN